MIFRQLFDRETCTFTYLLADAQSRDAVLIDPVLERVDRDAQLVRELGLRLLATLETHTHADHVTGASALKDLFGSDIVVPKRGGAVGADRYVGHGDVVEFGHLALEVRATPGHTEACVTFVRSDLSQAFTGDALLIRGCGRTDFQGGSSAYLFHSVHDQLLSLPSTTKLYPGHDYQGRTVTTVREERLYNPRLGGSKTEAGFVEIMGNLNLAYPKRIDVALPGNLRLGRPEGEVPPTPLRTDPWELVRRSGTGVPQVAIGWVADHAGAARVVDVRTPNEWVGPLGRIDGAELVPLETLMRAASGWDPDQPLVLVCRSSGRSDRAAALLEQGGFTRVASMSGGMLAWNAQGLPNHNLHVS